MKCFKSTLLQQVRWLRYVLKVLSNTSDLHDFIRALKVKSYHLNGDSVVKAQDEPLNKTFRTISI